MFFLPTPSFDWKPICQQCACAVLTFFKWPTCQSPNLAHGQASIWPHQTISNGKRVKAFGSLLNTIKGCQAPSDKLGDHALCCAFEGERISRHNALCDVLHATAVAAALGPSKESRFLLPGSGRKLTDILVPYWTAANDTAWDVTVTHPLHSV